VRVSDAANPGGTRGHSRITELAVVAVLAAIVATVVSVSIVGLPSRQGAPTAAPAHRAAGGTLTQRVPPAEDQPAGPVTGVAAIVLPSVVELSGSDSAASGVVLSTTGLILTNAHVLQGAGHLTATFQSGQTAPVRVIGSDTPADLAVVQAEGTSNLIPIQLGNSDSLRVGQQVIAVGSPFGLRGTVTSGIVSALNRPVPSAPQDQPPGLGGADGSTDLGGPGGAPGQPQAVPRTGALDEIQTDTALNLGNSGGPLVDMQGRIVGVNATIASVSVLGVEGGSIGLGFSIPINQTTRIAGELIATGHASQATLGVTAGDGAPTGAQLLTVSPGSPAARTGLKPGDVITKIGDQVITDSNALSAAIHSAAPHSTLDLTYTTTTAAASHTAPVTLDSLPAP
jgi:putative serine protease PepD